MTHPGVGDARSRKADDSQLLRFHQLFEPGIVWQQDPPLGGTLEVGESVTIWVNPIP